MSKVAGVYQIKNIVNGHIYIGSSYDVKKRWNEHRRALMQGTHHSAYLQNAWNKYGEANFTFTVLELVEDRDERLKAEQMFLDTVHPEYNIAMNAVAPAQGVPVSEETRRKISEAGKGRVFTEEHKRKISEGNKGKTVSEEARQKMSEAKIGKPNGWLGKHVSDETKRKLSVINTGRVFSEERNRKISEAHMGHKHSDETKRKIGESNKGKIITEEQRRKLSESLKGERNPNFGKHLSEETRAKLSEAHKGKHKTADGITA